MGLKVGIFNTSDRFFFSYTLNLATVQYGIISVGDVTEVAMFTVNGARCTNQLETANKQRIKQ